MLADPSSSLAIIVEFAIGLAGFSGVIAVFGGRDGWSGTDRFRTGNLIVLAMIPGFMALLTICLPVALGLFGQYTFLVLYLVLVCHLLMGAINFYRLIFRPNSDIA
jgi:hypothetical protein